MNSQSVETVRQRQRFVADLVGNMVRRMRRHAFKLG